jgi:DNA-binding response OmpR family regulator
MIENLITNISNKDKTVQINNSNVSITKQEARILTFFVANPHSNLTIDQIKEACWNNKETKKTSVQVSLNLLRRKIQQQTGINPIASIYSAESPLEVYYTYPPLPVLTSSSEEPQSDL